MTRYFLRIKKSLIQNFPLFAFHSPEVSLLGCSACPGAPALARKDQPTSKGLHLFTHFSSLSHSFTHPKNYRSHPFLCPPEFCSPAVTLQSSLHPILEPHPQPHWLPWAQEAAAMCPSVRVSSVGTSWQAPTLFLK